MASSVQLSIEILGDTIDIHGGGAGSEFHHTNEIALAEAKR